MKTTIFDYGMNGEGVAKLDGKICLIPNALTDEEVEISITNDQKNYAEANLTKIIKSSPNRVVPPCPYYFECGGCDLQHMNYAEQLKFKTILIKKTIKKISNLDVSVNSTIGCDTPFGYRNKISLNVQNAKLGFFKKSSKEIVEIDKCMLANEQINEIVMLCKQFFSTYPQVKDVKNIVIREINNQTLIGIVTKQKLNLKSFVDILKDKVNDVGLYQIVNTRKDAVVLSGKTYFEFGNKEIKIQNFNLTYYVDLLSFHQTNLDIQNKIYQYVLDSIDKNTTVINGFSGQGLLTAIVASKAKSVVGIEIEKSSHLSAETLKQDNKIKNMTNILGDFDKEIKKQKTADLLILDPSKKGCGDILNGIDNIPYIIYISCNPIALAKDLNILKNKYDIIEVTPFDMFPNTKNVETFVKLKLKGEQL